MIIKPGDLTRDTHGSLWKVVRWKDFDTKRWLVNDCIARRDCFPAQIVEFSSSRSNHFDLGHTYYCVYDTSTVAYDGRGVTGFKDETRWPRKIEAAIHYQFRRLQHKYREWNRQQKQRKRNEL